MLVSHAAGGAGWDALPVRPAVLRNLGYESTSVLRGPALRQAELRERETVKPLELFFDLVFVLGFTQCTALMAAHPSWSGIGRGMLVLRCCGGRGCVARG